MTQRDREILDQLASVIVPELQNLSKSFAPTIGSEIKETSTGFEFIIYGGKYIGVLVDGRKPTSTGAKKGNPTLQQIILAWIESKGITPRPTDSGKIPTTTELSWAISKSIHENGTRLYQMGGGNNIFDTIITNARIDNVLNLLGDSQMFGIESKVLREFKF